MARLPFDLIDETARKHGIEPAWLWLYLNGFKHRVPLKIREKIEDELLAENPAT